MRIPKWMYGIIREDKIIHECIRKSVGVSFIVRKMREVRTCYMRRDGCSESCKMKVKRNWRKTEED